MLVFLIGCVSGSKHPYSWQSVSGSSQDVEKDLTLCVEQSIVDVGNKPRPEPDIGFSLHTGRDLGMLAARRRNIIAREKWEERKELSTRKCMNDKGYTKLESPKR